MMYQDGNIMEYRQFDSFGGDGTMRALRLGAPLKWSMEVMMLTGSTRCSDQAPAQRITNATRRRKWPFAGYYP